MSNTAPPELEPDRVVEDVNGLKRGAERVEAASAVLAGQSRFLEATLSSIPEVISPSLTGCIRRIHAAIFNFMTGVMPPMPMLGRSLL